MNQDNKTKTSKLAIASFICLALSLVLGIVFNFNPTFLFIILFFGSIALSIIALTRVALGHNSIREIAPSFIVIILVAFGLISSALTPAMIRTETIFRRALWQENLQLIGTAFVDHATRFNGKVVDSDKWCDLIMEEAKLEPWTLSTDSSIGESSYALNKYVSNMRLSDIPPEVVLLFETNSGSEDIQPKILLKDRQFADSYDFDPYRDPNKTKVNKNQWNQTGGPESLKLDERYQDGCNVLFADGTARWIRVDQLPDLKWKPDGQVSLPENLAKIVEAQAGWQSKADKLLWPIFIIPALTTLIIIAKYHSAKCWIFAIILAALSAAFGGALGAWAQFFYSPPTSHISGMSSGAFFGVLSAFGYVFLAFAIASKLKSPEITTSWAIPLGMLTGAICSTLVHATLIITTRLNIYSLLIMGLPFGTIAGLILGAITAAVLNHQANNEIPNSDPQEITA